MQKKLRKIAKNCENCEKLQKLQKNCENCEKLRRSIPPPCIDDITHTSVKFRRARKWKGN